MPQIKVTLDHELGKQEARQRVDRWLRNAGSSDLLSPLTYDWIDKSTATFELVVKKARVNGEIVVQAASIAVTVQLPWMLAVFARPIKKQIRQQAERVLVA
jgi:hypothetical protein